MQRKTKLLRKLLEYVELSHTEQTLPVPAHRNLRQSAPICANLLESRRGNCNATPSPQRKERFAMTLVSYRNQDAPC